MPVDFEEDVQDFGFEPEEEAVPAIDWNVPARSPEELASRSFYGAKMIPPLPLPEPGTPTAREAAQKSLELQMQRERARQTGILEPTQTALTEAEQQVYGVAHPIKTAEALTEATASQIAGKPMAFLPGWKPSEVLERPIAKIPEVPKAGPAVVQAAGGLVNAGIEFANFFLTPEGLATLGIAGIPKLLQRSIVMAFGTQMATDAPQRFNAAIDAAKSGDWHEAGKQAGAFGIESAAGAKMLQHGISRPGISAAPATPIPPASVERAALAGMAPTRGPRVPVLERPGEIRVEEGPSMVPPEGMVSVPGATFTQLIPPEMKVQARPELVEAAAEAARIARERQAKEVGGGKVSFAAEAPTLLRTAMEPRIKAEPEVPAVKAEVAAEPAAPSIREQLESMMTMPVEEGKAYKGGWTQMAWDIGSKAKTPEDVAALRNVAEKVSARKKELMKAGKIEEAYSIISRQPEEAYEYATGVKLNGTPKWELLEQKVPGYKPPVPDAKYLEAKGIKPTAEPSRPTESETAFMRRLPERPEGTVRLFRGEGAPEGAGTAGSFFSANLARARSFGGKVSFVDVPVEVAAEAQKAAREAGSGTKTDFVLPNEWVNKAKEVSEKVPERVQEIVTEPPKPTPVTEPEPAGALGITSPGGRMVMDAFEKVNRTRQALGSIFKAGSERRLMDQTMDAADNMAHIAGAQARKSLDIGTTSLDRKAAMAIVETNGNRAKLADFLRQATGKNDEAVRAVNHAIANWDRLQPLAQRTRNLLDHQLASENAAGINTEFREAYVPHIYDMDLLMGQGRPYVISGAGKGTATGFKKGRTFDTVFDAIEAGYTPRTLDVGQLVEHRVKVGQRLMNRKSWAEGLKTVNDPSTGTPIVTELERKQRGPGGTWYETPPLGYAAREIIPGVRIAVHEGHASLFDALTGTSRISGSLPGKALLEAAGGIKHGLLLFDTFHVSRILQKELFLTGRVGYKKGLSLLEYSDADLGRAVQEGLITQDMADYARANRTDAQLLIKNGLNVGRIQEALYTSIVRQIKGLGTFNKWVFEKMTRGAMMESGLIELERVQAARPELTREQAARIVARDLNTYFGNLGRQGLFKSQTAQDMARLVALAPQWVESMARSEAKGAYQLGKGLTYDPLVHKSIMVGSLGKGLGQGLLAYFIGTQLLNLATRKQFTWQNEEQDHKMDAWIPDVTGKGNGFFISPFSVVAELTHDMIRYSHSEGNKLDAAIRIASNKASPLVRAGKILLTGRTFGKEYVKDPWDRAKTAAVSLAPAPIPAQPLIRGQARPGDIQRQLTASLGFKTEAAPSAAEQISDRARNWMKSIGKESNTEILQTPDAPYKRLRHAIRMGNDEEARDAIKDLKKTRKDDEILQAMRHSENAPFTGSLRWEKVFKRSLSPEEMGIYVRAAQERKLDHAKFMNLWRRASG